MNKLLTVGQTCQKLHPDKIPVIIKSDITPNLDKFLVSKNFTLAYIIYHYKNKYQISPNETIFAFINKKTVDINKEIYILYNQSKDNLDHCLHVNLYKESTFGFYTI